MKRINMICNIEIGAEVVQGVALFCKRMSNESV